nr:DUF3237 family protein [uncultured Carboxylicivirga sp.]
MNSTSKLNSIVVAVILLFLFISRNTFAQSPETEKGDSIYLDFKMELMWKAKVKIGKTINVGESKRGSRHMIPIIGGTFRGPNINGEVFLMVKTGS